MCLTLFIVASASRDHCRTFNSVAKPPSIQHLTDLRTQRNSTSMESSFPAGSSITASLSGNVHSRLTASNAQRRLRAHIRSISSELHSEDMDEKQELPIEHSPILPLHRRPRISTNKLRISLRWLVTLYCFFSLALLSLHLFYGLVDDVVAISWKGIPKF